MLSLLSTVFRFTSGLRRELCLGHGVSSILMNLIRLGKEIELVCSSVDLPTHSYRLIDLQIPLEFCQSRVSPLSVLPPTPLAYCHSRVLWNLVIRFLQSLWSPRARPVHAMCKCLSL